jgi:AcrR family transcriptional regulator
MLLFDLMSDANTDQPAAPGNDGAESPTRRAAKKERTRQRLIEAAAEVIAERGFHAASLIEIASRAGLSTGAVYSNFRGKESLFLAVIRETAVPFDLGPIRLASWERISYAATMAMRGVDLPQTRRLLKLQLEFALVALQDPSLHRAAAQDRHSDGEELAAVLGAIGPVPRPNFTPTSEQLATAVIATLQGLQQHRFLDRESVPEELAGWAMLALLHMGQNVSD